MINENETDQKLIQVNQNLLESFFSLEGIYYEIIKEDGSLDNGTKILYLLRAITVPSQEFLVLLDKLYSGDLTKEKQSDRLEVVRAFKLINDLFLNTPVKYGVWGIRTAHSHYFVGAVDEEIVKSAIKKLIDAAIIDLSSSNSEHEKMNRIESEKTIAPNPGWRLSLDLANQQLTLDMREMERDQVSFHLCTILNIPKEALDKLPEADRLGLNNIIQQKFKHIEDKYHVSQQEIMVLSKEDRKEVLLFIAEAGFLKAIGLTIKDWPILVKDNKSFLIHLDYYRVPLMQLIRLHNFPANKILQFNSDRLALFSLQYERIVSLIEKVQFPMKRLVSISDIDELAATIVYERSVICLVKELSLSIDDLMAIPFPVRKLFLEYSQNVIQLVNDEHINIETLIELSKEKLETLFKTPNTPEAESILDELRSHAPRFSCR